MRALVVFGLIALLLLAAWPSHTRASEEEDDETALDEEDAPTIKAAAAATGTDAGTVEREERAVRLDGLSVADAKALRGKAQKYEFQAEVNRMMKLIINSLYKNKDIFLRELISNASDALDKIRLLSLTDKSVLGEQPQLNIKIHVDKQNKVLHITDTGIGMTKEELVKNLGTIAKSGTAEFLAKVQEGSADTSSLIGQFGVGFYSSFLVADQVIVTSKSNEDKQHIWTSDANTFSVVEDPREDEQLGRGTRVSLVLKEEAQDFLEENRIRDLIKKYSEFINFDIYLYTSKEVEIDEKELEAEAEAVAEGETEELAEDEDDAAVEDAEEDNSAGPTQVKTTKTVWDWEVLNANKPIWTRTPKEIEAAEYHKFYKAFTKTEKEPLGYIHFTAEGEVTFRSILYIPSEAPQGFFSEYGKNRQSIKLYVRRVFITDNFEDILPKYLAFLQGVVDSDDLPLNVSRETLQQHKLLKVIKKRLVRKALDMIKKLSEDDYKKFWKEFGTGIKLGLIEDYSNRTKLAKLLRFASSNSMTEWTSLEAYGERMKDTQKHIYFMAGASRKECETSPFVERLLKRGYEVLYMVEPVDEYTIQNLPEFDGKKFKNVAKEGLELDEPEAAKKYKEEQTKEFEPLTKFLTSVLATDIDKAIISDRLSESPCALVASQYGWSGNMQRIMSAQAYAKAEDINTSFYASQKKTMEINPRHPLIKALLQRVKAHSAEAAEGVEGVEGEGAGPARDEALEDTAHVLLDTARLRSGYAMQDSVAFAQRIERMLRANAGVDADAKVEEEPPFEADAPDAEAEAEEGGAAAEDDQVADEPEHEEL